MQMLVFSAVAVGVLGWWLSRMERDHPLRILSMAALAGASLWLVWAAVELAPLRPHDGPIWATAPAGQPAAPPGFWARLTMPGLNAARIGLLLLVAATVLALWPLSSTSGRVLRTVLSLCVAGGSLLLLLALGFAVVWSQGREWPVWRGDAVVNGLALLLAAIAVVRQGIARKAPLILGARDAARGHGAPGRKRTPGPPWR